MPRTRASAAGGGSGYYVRDLTMIAHNDVESARTANRVNYTPIQVFHPLTVDGIIVVNGAVAVGNRYVALYDSLNEVPNNRLAVSASVLASGANQRQYIPFAAPVQIQGGYYFVAVETDNADGMQRACLDGSEMNPAAVGNGPNFYYQDMGAYLIPPLVATPVLQTSYFESSASHSLQCKSY